MCIYRKSIKISSTQKLLVKIKNYDHVLKFLSLKLFSHNQPKGNNGDDDNNSNMTVVAKSFLSLEYFHTDQIQCLVFSDAKYSLISTK